MGICFFVALAICVSFSILSHAQANPKIDFLSDVPGNRTCRSLVTLNRSIEACISARGQEPFEQLVSDEIHTPYTTNNPIKNIESIKCDSTQPLIFFPKNNIYLEILGCGGLYSLNYERLAFHNKRHAIYVRVGGGMYPWYQGTRWTFPVLVNYRIAINNSISIEAGFGGSYIHENKYWQSSTYKYDMLYLNGTIGFNFIVKKHFLIKTAFTPSISTSYYNPMPLSGGLSLGYSFGLPEYLRNYRASRFAASGRDFSPRNSIFLELFGGGYIYSLNYEHVYVAKKYHSLDNSIGYTFIKWRDSYYNVIPIFFNYQYKISLVTSIKFGLGIRGVASDALKWNAQNESYPVRGIDLLGNIGFRFLITNNLFIKTEIKPLIINNSELFSKDSKDSYMHWLGVSFGYCWGKGQNGKKPVD